MGFVASTVLSRLPWLLLLATEVETGGPLGGAGGAGGRGDVLLPFPEWGGGGGFRFIPPPGGPGGGGGRDGGGPFGGGGGGGDRCFFTPPLAAVIGGPEGGGGRTIVCVIAMFGKSIKRCIVLGLFFTTRESTSGFQ